MDFHGNLSNDLWMPADSRVTSRLHLINLGTREHIDC